MTKEVFRSLSIGDTIKADIKDSPKLTVTNQFIKTDSEGVKSYIAVDFPGIPNVEFSEEHHLLFL